MALDDLQGFQGDLKTLSEENYRKLREEIIRDGFSEPISVWHKGTKPYFILNGHQRLTTLRRMREDGFEVPPIPISFVDALDEKAAKRKVLALTSQYGEITQDGLTEFIKAAELDFGDVAKSFVFPEIDFGPMAASFNHFPHADGTFGTEPDPNVVDLYSKKIEVPIYEPKSDTPPPIADLVDINKTIQLLGKIDQSKIPEDVKEFLRLAAARHSVFNYERIAEYYSHAPKDIQELMEESALVLIDFKKAIENGFVAMSEKLIEAYLE